MNPRPSRFPDLDEVLSATPPEGLYDFVLPPSEARPRFDWGDTVEWAGPERFGHGLHLRAGHPGVVHFFFPMAITVRWVDKVGAFDHEGIFWDEWLAPITVEDFYRRAEDLRDSDWAGFPPGRY